MCTHLVRIKHVDEDFSVSRLVTTVKSASDLRKLYNNLHQTTYAEYRRFSDLNFGQNMTQAHVVYVLFEGFRPGTIWFRTILCMESYDSMRYHAWKGKPTKKSLEET